MPPSGSPSVAWPDHLIPPALRLPALGIIALCALAAAILAEQFAGTHRAGHVDRAADARLVNHFGDDIHLMEILRALGSPAGVIVICVALCVVLAALRHWRLAVLCIAGPLMVGVTVDVLKPLLGRRFHGFFSFPSGHTAGATAVAMLVVLLLIAIPFASGAGSGGRTASVTVRLAIAAGALAYVAGVATAMVVLDNHYFTDTAGGFAVSVGVMLTVALLIDCLRPKEPAPTDRQEDLRGIQPQ